MSPWIARIAIGLSTCCLCVVPAGAQVVISDSDFSDGNWSTTLTRQDGSAGSPTAGQVATGGNPGAYRQMTHPFTGAGGIGVFHEYLGASYDPATQGPIVSIDYSEDSNQFNPPFPGAAIGATVALVQNGVIYVGPSLTYTFTTWTTQTLTGLTAANFVQSGGSANPDFSLAGGVIRFGYLRSNTNTGDASYTTTHGIDNWSVTITAAQLEGQPVPTMSRIGIAVLAVLTLVIGVILVARFSGSR